MIATPESRLGRVISLALTKRPAWALFLIAWVTSALITTGGLSVDTARRLQVTRWIWAGEPQVALNDDYIGNNLPGRSDLPQAQFGIGQSLLLLPGDVLGAAVSRLLPQRLRSETRVLVLWFVTFPLINAAGVVTAYFLCRELGATTPESFLAALCLLSATTFLHYCQNPQENNLLFLLTAAGLLGGLRWAQDADCGWMFLTAAALGFALLVRVTMVVTAGIVVVAFWAYVPLHVRPAFIGRYLRSFFGVGVPVFLLFVAAERSYHWYRFGDLHTTYASRLVQVFAERDPNSPPGYPFGYPMTKGLAGPFLDLEKSIFLFDPLLFLLPLALRQARASARLCTLLVLSLAILAGTVLTYSTSHWWAGDSSWGCRHCSVPVHLLCLLGALFGWQNLWKAGPWQRASFVGLLAVAILFQLLSILMDFNVENAQRIASKRPLFIPYERFLNVVTQKTNTFEYFGRNFGEPVVSELAANHWLLPLRLERFVSRSISTVVVLVWGVCLGLLAGTIIACVNGAIRRSADNCLPELPVDLPEPSPYTGSAP